ncbi:MAG: 1-acyl-sn-glycerol-3-phosphate acyltransferase [Burkholderiaceae bacterium]|nr:1-acyl-sn-glycerol-3-phosphate acyltransferase [Sulfuritalea sp.]MCF8173699.1 1-acyl-sn-glycerol-3-phosphate acyltransferase [Burkholderiaceae bacterium]
MALRSLIVRTRLLLIGLHLLFGALQVALLFRFSDAARRQHLKRCWSRQLLDLLGIRVDAAGSDLAAIEAGLLVANHISFIDIFVINALLPSAFVAKSDLLKWPLIGWLSRHSDTVFIERGSRKAAHLTQRHLRRALDAGGRLAVFPEGTTTAGDRLLPFHAALFQGAIDAKVPVHALALSYRQPGGARSEAPAYVGDDSLLDCLRRVLRARGLVARITLVTSFTPPLPERRQLARHAHHVIAAALAFKPAATPARVTSILRKSERPKKQGGATSP